jgi:hypothetical protein
MFTTIPCTVVLLQAQLLLRLHSATLSMQHALTSSRILKITLRTSYSCYERRDESDANSLITNSITGENKLSNHSVYDSFSDRLVTWNEDVCRKETGTAAGKGHPHPLITFVFNDSLCDFLN